MARSYQLPARRAVVGLFGLGQRRHADLKQGGNAVAGVRRRLLGARR